MGGFSFQIANRKISFHPGQKLTQASIAMNLTKRKQKWRETKEIGSKVMHDRRPSAKLLTHGVFAEPQLHCTTKATFLDCTNSMGK